MESAKLLAGAAEAAGEPVEASPAPVSSPTATATAAASGRRRGTAFAVTLVAGGALLVAVGSAMQRSVGAAPGRTAASTRAFMQADEVAKCTSDSGNCNVTKCCAALGMQCYAQDKLYAQCRSSCNPGPIPTHWDSKPWSCEPLGKRAEGEAKCSKAGQNCLHTQCCEQAGTQCFQKNAGWATCKAECTAGAPDVSDQDGEPWSCKKLGPFTPGAQGWVWQECAKDGENCAQKKCCLTGGSQCYSQQGPASAPYWAQCKPACTKGEKPNPWDQPWNCDEIGSRTPSAPPKGGLLAPWAQKKCSRFGENCMESKCCVGVDAMCYEKNSKWATCQSSCTAGENPFDNNETWSCKQLSSRGVGLAVKGFPSLFCFSLMRTEGYEAMIMQGQLNYSIGIFACDEAAVFSTDGGWTLGEGPDGPVKTIGVEKAVIKTTMDGTAGNAKLFANMWDKVIEDGRWRNHAWTIKADPDAVLIPERLRWHVAAHTGEKVYVLNCNKVPGSPNFPMMFGSVEIFAFGAMDTFSTGKETCKQSMGQWLESWGEDYYMGKCMDLIKVGRISDFGVVGDSVCTGVDCNNPSVGGFHAFKSWGAWSKCHQQAENATKKR